MKIFKDFFYESWSPSPIIRFDQFLTQKNDFESMNFDMFDKVVHNFGESDDDMI